MRGLIEVYPRRSFREPLYFCRELILAFFGQSVPYDILHERAGEHAYIGYAPPGQTALDVFCRQLRADAQTLRYYNGALSEHFGRGAVRHPARCKVVQQSFHRARGVHRISGRRHDYEVGFHDRFCDMPNIFEVLAFALILDTAPHASAAKTRAVLRQIELRYFFCSRVRLEPRQEHLFEPIRNAALPCSVYHSYLHSAAPTISPISRLQ